MQWQCTALTGARETFFQQGIKIKNQVLSRNKIR